MKNKYDSTIKDKVCKDIENGMSIEDAVKKWEVSAYYAKLWTKEVYKNKDLDTYVRKRYKLIAASAREEMIVQMGNALTEEETEVLTDETWEKWDSILKSCMYDFAKEIVAYN